jgi:hypothetical protein
MLGMTRIAVVLAEFLMHLRETTGRPQQDHKINTPEGGEK